MIQRIQSLYLLVATALMSLTLFTPIATFVVDSGDVFTLTAFNLEGDQESQSTIWMGIVLVLATVLPFVTINIYIYRHAACSTCIECHIYLLTLPLTLECTGALTNPPASPNKVPTFTMSPFFTTGCADAPMC